MIEWIAAHQFVLTGIIFMLVIGPAIGNYACSVIYRLPRGQTPFERHPFCGSCGADLKPIDLFPIISWCLTGGKCRYCRSAVPILYTYVEIACAAVFVFYFIGFGIGEVFLLAAAYAVFTIILAAIQWQQGWVSASIYSYAFLFAALLRTMVDGTIFGWVQTSFVTLVACLVVQKLHSVVMRNEFCPFDTPWIWWLTLMAVWIPYADLGALAVPVALLLIFRFLCSTAGPFVLVPISAFALLLPLAI